MAMCINTVSSYLGWTVIGLNKNHNSQKLKIKAAGHAVAIPEAILNRFCPTIGLGVLQSVILEEWIQT